MNTTGKCVCCGSDNVEPIYELKNDFIYNDFDQTGQEVDPIWCGESWEIIGFKDHCSDCKPVQPMLPPQQSPSEIAKRFHDDLPI